MPTVIPSRFRLCAVQNFNEGDHIVTAMIGAVLPGDFKIKEVQVARR